MPVTYYFTPMVDIKKVDCRTVANAHADYGDALSIVLPA